MPELSIRDAAGRLGVSVDTVRRRIKAGELEARRVPRGASGFQWLVTLPEPEPAGDAGEDPPAGSAATVAELRATVAGLERLLEDIAGERDAWKEQAQRAQVIAEQAQRVALASRPALPEHATAPAPEPDTTPPAGEDAGRRSMWDWLRDALGTR